jgi:CCR4-NOT transcription complex subunit 6
MVRSSRSPHHRARANAMAARSVTKNAITIANPNKPPPEVNGISGDSSPLSVDAHSEGSPSATIHSSAAATPLTVVPRPLSIRPPENTWTSLDMGGVNIKNLPSSSGLFSFTFLVTLYLNHNALTSLPPEIAKLRHLELLDLSGNNLTSLPPELGMLTQLKELYVFDNHLSTLPPEVGSLHHLLTFGVEGNPLDATLKSLVQKDGTPALISYLRDTGPVPAPPPERAWKYILSPVEQEALMNDPNSETITVLSYNILCEKYATERLYGYTPAWALLWDYRKELILNELLGSEADFLCIQEMDVGQYEEYFSQHLSSRDYTGVYWPKSRAKTMDNDQERRLVDGCAIFYKTSRCVSHSRASGLLLNFIIDSSL